MAITKKQLKNLIQELEKYRARNTELITILVPAGGNINEIKTMVTSEAGTATNIKSKTTRKNVIGALKRIDQKLKEYPATPPNGLCIFSGNISDKEGVSDIRIWAFEPPEPLNQKLYRCDKEFILDPLRAMIEEKEVYGLLTIDKSEAAVGFLRGRHLEVDREFESLVPGKTSKGGQSAQRFERVREGLLKAFLKEVGEYATKRFEEEPHLLGIIVGGPGVIKDMFLEGDYLSERVKRMIVGTRDTSYAGGEGIRELYERAQDLLEKTRAHREKMVIDDFFGRIKRDDGTAVYGYEEVMRLLPTGAVERVIISEDIDLAPLRIECPSCGYTLEKTMRKSDAPTNCPQCGNKTNITETGSLLEQIEDLASKTSTEVVVVSSETPEGATFLNIGGIGAVLRYRME